MYSEYNNLEHLFLTIPYGIEKLAIFIILNLLITCIILLLTYILSKQAPDHEKKEAYECGFAQYENTRKIFDIQFYLFAIIFLIFDLEAMFFYPWCLCYSSIESQGFLYMLDFILELIIGYIYAWLCGAFTWKDTKLNDFS